jgi:hypothetical protein
MRLIDTLEQTIASEDSPFRAQLLREDVKRIGELSDAAHTARDANHLAEQALQLNWTASAERTQELAEPVGRLSHAVFALVQQSDPSDALQTEVERAWLELHRTRLERMVGCLSTPLPRPVD